MKGETRMARARTIKPSFFKNEALAECPPLARLLFVGLWCIADREGRVEERPLRIKAELLPYEAAEVGPLLEVLERKGLVRRYEAGGVRVVLVLNFVKHQRPHPKEPKSELPGPPDDRTTAAEPCFFTARQETAAASCASNPLILQSSNPTPASVTEGQEAAVRPAEFVAAWNAVRAFAQVRDLTGTRLKHFQARARNAGWARDWRPALDRAAGSAFCCGSNDRGWRATVDWFLRPDTVTKILEGVYDRAGKGEAAGPVETTPERQARILREMQARRQESGLTEEVRAAVRRVISAAAEGTRT